jgi:hypothetical protein
MPGARIGPRESRVGGSAEAVAIKQTAVNMRKTAE